MPVLRSRGETRDATRLVGGWAGNVSLKDREVFAVAKKSSFCRSRRSIVLRMASGRAECGRKYIFVHPKFAARKTCCGMERDMLVEMGEEEGKMGEKEGKDTHLESNSALSPVLGFIVHYICSLDFSSRLSL